MSTLAGKKIVVVGGSSGIGFSVAKLSLLSLADSVVVASSSAERVQKAVANLQALIQEKGLPGRVTGETINAADTAKVQTFVKGVGEIDHLVWTSGDPLKVGFPDLDLEKVKGMELSLFGASQAQTMHLYRWI